MATILCICDDSQTIDSMPSLLSEWGYQVEAIANASNAHQMISARSFDVAILYEKTESTFDTVEICRELRDAYPSLGVVLLLSQIEDDATRLRAYQAGVDDCFYRFIPIAEIKARIAVLVNRCSLPDIGKIKYGTVTIDLLEQTATIEGSPVELTPIQFRLLKHLLLNRGRIIDSKELKRSVFRSNERANGAKLRVHIFELRRKLGRENKLIQSAKGKGYGIGLTI